MICARCGNCIIGRPYPVATMEGGCKVVRRLCSDCRERHRQFMAERHPREHGRGWMRLETKAGGVQ